MDVSLYTFGHMKECVPIYNRYMTEIDKRLLSGFILENKTKTKYGSCNDKKKTKNKGKIQIGQFILFVYRFC